MDSQIIDDGFGNTLNDQMRLYIKEIANWSFFLSIVGFVFIGFMVLFGLFAGVILGSMMGDELLSMMALGPGMLSGMYLIMALIYFFPVFYLFRFASKARVSLRSGNDTELTEAFENLKSHYKFMGILTIVVIAIYFLFFVFASIGGMFALF
jgi:hypothetical protein